jgi:[ribosomal protein S5]-alanine N-acetyltransferase
VSDPPVLRTSRLLLRPFTNEDCPAVERLAGDERVADTTLTIPHPYPPGAALEWIAMHPTEWQTGTGLILAITDGQSGELFGSIGLTIEADHGRAELGYWVGVPYWNRGYCTEAGEAMIDFAFGPLDLHRVHSHHFTRNPASGRVMQKLGMQFEGVQRAAVKKGGRFEDLACYAVLATDRT